NSGFGMTQQFSFVASSPVGSGNVAGMYFIVNTEIFAANSCYFKYSAPTNQLFLENNAGNNWGAGGVLGSATTLSNSQCSINLANSTFTPSGDDITVGLAISFAASYVGPKKTFMQALDLKSEGSGWQQLGTWLVSPVA